MVLPLAPGATAFTGSTSGGSNVDATGDDAHLAFEEEAATLVAEDEMHFDSVAGSDDTPPPVTAAERQQAVVQHRFKRANNDPSTAPRRVVTLRDARRGRPRRSSGKHGADPPG